jgi:hypothetical protein
MDFSRQSHGARCSRAVFSGKIVELAIDLSAALCVVLFGAAAESSVVGILSSKFVSKDSGDACIQPRAKAVCGV